jgi:hypothetical protein
LVRFRAVFRRRRYTNSDSHTDADSNSQSYTNADAWWRRHL